MVKNHFIICIFLIFLIFFLIPTNCLRPPSALWRLPLWKPPGLNGYPFALATLWTAAALEHLPYESQVIHNISCDTSINVNSVFLVSPSDRCQTLHSSAKGCWMSHSLICVMVWVWCRYPRFNDRSQHRQVGRSEWNCLFVKYAPCVCVCTGRLRSC